MKQEIERHVRANSAAEDSFTAEFLFPASFTGFDGHFPEQPVLPGLCLIQAVLAAAEKALERKLELTEIVLAKFIAVSQPEETLTAVCKADEDMLRAEISRGSDRVAEIRLRVRDA